MEFSSRLQYKPFSFTQILRKIFLQIINLVQMLPRKIYICTAEMSVCRSLFVDRAAEIKHFDDSSRAKVKVLTDNLYQFRIRYFTCAKCFYMNRSRMCNTNCIGKLDLALVSKTCCNNVLCNITCCISCRTVNLCAVFSGEGTAAVTSCSAISINNDLTSCKTAVAVWSTDNERPVG